MLTDFTASEMIKYREHARSQRAETESDREMTQRDERTARDALTKESNKFQFHANKTKH